MSSKAFLLAFALTAAPGLALAQADAAKPAATPAKPAARAKAADGKTVETLTVTGAAPDVQTSIDRRSYTLGKDLQATTGSIADALRNVPSVDVDLQGNLSLRGDSNVTILVDGKPSPQFEGAGRADALQQLPADQIERVEVITNPSAALNPEGSGGVINLISKKSRGAGVTGSAYATAGSGGLKRAGLSFGYNSPKLSITGAVSGNYQRNKNHGHEVRGGLDPVSGQILDNLHDFVGRNLARTPSGRISLSYTPDAKDQLSASFSYNELLFFGHPHDRYVDEDASGATTGTLDIPGHRRFEEIDVGVTGGWKHTFGEGHELSLDLVANESRPRDHQTYANLQAPVPFAQPFEARRDDANQKHTEIKLAYVRPMSGGATLKAGYEWKHDDNDFNHVDGFSANPTAIAPIPALANHLLFQATINAVYATYERSFGDLGAQVGLRIEDMHWDLDQQVTGQTASSRYTRPFPTLHLSYKLDDERKLTASYSRRIQRPPAFLLNPLVAFLDPKNQQQGNPGLRPEQIESYEVGYEHHPSGGGIYQATLYYRQYDGDFSAVLRDLGNGVFLTTFDNLGSSRSAGLELVANGKLTPTLSYNASSNIYWRQIDAGNLAIGAGVREAWGVNGRTDLNWQARPSDLFQLNLFARGPQLSAQGVSQPNWVLNLGWRHKFTDRISATLTAQDLAATQRFQRKLDTATVHDRFLVEPVARALMLRLDYRFGGGGKSQRDPGFEYENGGPPQP